MHSVLTFTVCLLTLFCNLSCFAGLSHTDTTKAKELCELAWQLKFKNPDSSLVLTRTAYKLANGHPLILWQCHRNMGVMFSIKGILDSSLHYNNRAYNQALELSNLKLQANSLQNIGIVYSQQGNDKKALDVYKEIILIASQIGDSLLVQKNSINMGLSLMNLGNYPEASKKLNEALRLAEILNDTAGMVNACKNLSNCFYYLKEFATCEYYAKRTLNLAQTSGNIKGQAFAMNSLGHIELNRKKYQEGLRLFQKELELCKRLNDRKGQAVCLHTISMAYFQMKKYSKAKQYLEESFQLKKKIGDKTSIGVYYQSLANILKAENQTDKALFYLDSAAICANQTENMALLKDVFTLYKELWHQKGNYKKAGQFSDSLLSIKDSMYNLEKNKEILALEARYQSQLKQNQIDLQQAQILNSTLELKKQKTILVSILVVFALFGFVVVIIWYVWRKRKQQQLELAIKNEELATRQYENLYKETQLIAMKEKIAGQEEERSRIARELHDGVGGTLAAVKFQLEQRKEKPSDEDITHLLQTITTTWEEVRSISHNLMPPQFEFLTLPSVLGHFLNSLSKAGKCHFEFQSIPTGGWDKAGQNLQVEIYRIVQEVCGNILKHSGATNASVFLNMENYFIRLTIEDNGKAFVNNRQTDGIGQISIAQRLLALHGKSETERLPDGNMYIFEIPLKSNVAV